MVTVAGEGAGSARPGPERGHAMRQCLQPKLFAALLAIAGAPALAGEDPAIAQMFLDEAAEACRTNDVDAFFEAFLQSEAVRKAHTARDLTVVTNAASGREARTVAGESYADFPLAIFDYYYTTAEGVDENGYTHVLIEKNQSADNRLRIDWVRVSYDGQGEGDDPGNIVDSGAEPGVLLFYPTPTCWELVQVETTAP